MNINYAKQNKNVFANKLDKNMTCRLQKREEREKMTLKLQDWNIMTRYNVHLQKYSIGIIQNTERKGYYELYNKINEFQKSTHVWMYSPQFRLCAEHKVHSQALSLFQVIDMFKVVQ